MGYEIEFFYHERGEDGRYDTETRKSFTKSIGRRGAEIQVERVAAVVMGHLARRDVWIVDVKIAEFARREVTFKETKDGIIIKNKKFHFDQLGGDLTSEDVSDEPITVPVSAAQHRGTPPARTVVSQPAVVTFPKVYRPHRDDLATAQRQGIKLTPGRQYDILRERELARGQPPAFTLVDDAGGRIEISSCLFEDPRVGIDDYAYDGPHQGKLSFMDEIVADTMDLRGGLR